MQKFCDFPLAHKMCVCLCVWAQALALKRFGDAVNDDGNGK